MDQRQGMLLKYTGKTIDLDMLDRSAARDGAGGSARALRKALDDMEWADSQLHKAAAKVQSVANRVISAVVDPADSRGVKRLNRLGELQSMGPALDICIAVRELAIEALQYAVATYLRMTGEAS